MKEIELAEKDFFHMKDNTNWMQQWLGRFTEAPGFFRDAIRSTHLLPTEVSSYQTTKTGGLANIVKILQGARPSDFDWKKLEVLFPKSPDNADLAAADFAAIRAIARATLQAAAEAEQISSQYGISIDDAFRKKGPKGQYLNKGFGQLEILGRKLKSDYGDLAAAAALQKPRAGLNAIRAESATLHGIVTDTMGSRIVDIGGKEN
jgi:hypothetical protein